MEFARTLLATLALELAWLTPDTGRDKPDAGRVLARLTPEAGRVPPVDGRLRKLPALRLRIVLPDCGRRCDRSSRSRCDPGMNATLPRLAAELTRELRRELARLRDLRQNRRKSARNGPQMTDVQPLRRLSETSLTIKLRSVGMIAGAY